ncbi:MAG: hypothetical protein HYZ44_11470 [Bacteroidetes bacterium]|nr:hypothetical protein [Bacteroidota bacterium]
MADQQETIHAKNIAAFYELIGACNDLGKAYAPEAHYLHPEALSAQLSASRVALEEMKDTKARLNKAMRARDTSFRPIAALANKVLRELIRVKASPKAIGEARNHTRHIHASGCQKAQPKTVDKKTNDNAKNDPAAVSPNYTKVIDHFGQLLQTVTREPNYLPQHLDLKVIMLNLMLQELRSKHSAVVFVELSLHNERLTCTQAIYGQRGLIQLAHEVAEHIATITQSSGAIYKKVNALKFIPLTEKKVAVASLK